MNDFDEKMMKTYSETRNALKTKNYVLNGEVLKLAFEKLINPNKHTLMGDLLK